MKLRLAIISTLLLFLISCEDDPPTAGCDGSLRLEVASIVNSACGDNTGSINLSSSGGSGDLMYSLDGGTAQGASSFTGVAQGSYTLKVTDSEGCDAEVTAKVETGLLIDDIRPIITTNCAVTNCHNGDRDNLPNFALDNILIENASAVKTRTSNETMPPAGRDDLTADEIQRIACWVDDGAPE